MKGIFQKALPAAMALALAWSDGPTLWAQSGDSKSSKSVEKNPKRAAVEEILEESKSVKDSKQFDNIAGRLLAALDELLASEPSESDEVFGIRNKINVLWARTARQKEGAADALEEYCEPLRDDKRAAIAAEARAYHVAARVMKLTPKSQDDPAPLQADIEECLKKYPLTRIISDASQMLVLHLMGRDANLEAKTANEAFLAALESRTPDRNVQQLKKIYGALNEKIDRVGKPLELTGKIVGGKKFDLKSLKGKVVLVDFWATWCEPCKVELPNIRAVYDKYRDNGFEVVGVSIDSSLQDLEEFLQKEPLAWQTLFDEPETDGEPGPLATRLKIVGIPAPILVDQKGNIASFNARGDMLEPLVTRLLGIEPEPDAESQGEAPAAGPLAPSADEPKNK